MPRALYEAIAAGLRYYIRFTGYLFLFLVTATYPWACSATMRRSRRPAPGGWAGNSPGGQPGHRGGR